MSDFDKEAEREKLREKYERDKEKRKATEQMSELLLKGATMTNSHCGTCGDPIFRYEGQEFCATCEEVVAEADADGTTESATGDGETDATESATGEGGLAETGPDTRVGKTDTANTVENGRAAGQEPSESSAPEATPSEQRAEQPQDSTPPTQPGGSNPEPAVSRGQPAAERAPTPADTPASGADAPAPDTDAKSLAAARASLTRTVTRLARQAEAAEDLERTRTHLLAAEEAADALAAVKQAER